MGSLTHIFAEDCPRVSIRLLKQQGLLGELGGRLVVRIAGLEVLVFAMDPSTALFAWKDEEESHRQKIEMAIVYLRFGERPVFICPLTGANCYELFLAEGSWASSKGHGLRQAGRHGSRLGRQRAKLDNIHARLEGLEGLPKARGSRRSRLVNEALSVPYGGRIIPAIEDAAWQENEKQQRTASRVFRSSRKSGPYSTEAALAGGRAKPYTGVGARDPKSLIAIIRGAKTASFDWEVLRQRPRMLLENFAALDARSLNGLWVAKGPALATLIWPAGMEGANQFMLAVDLSEHSDPAAGVCRLSPDGPSFQPLELQPAGAYKPGNWVFLCPVLRTRHDILFLRDGFFASAKAQRLIHASQRA